MEKIFDKLPYDTLENIKAPQMYGGAAVLFLLILLGYYFTVYSTVQQEYTDNNNKKIQLENTLKRNQALVATAGRVSREHSTLRGNINESKRQMPLAKEMPSLLTEVHSVKEDLGLELIRFELQEGRHKDFYKEIPLSITVRGGFYETVGFFDKLQDLLQVVSFSKLKMEAKKAQAGKKRKGRRSKKRKSGGQEVMITTNVKAKTYAYIKGSEDKPAGSDKKKDAKKPAPPAPPKH